MAKGHENGEHLLVAYGVVLLCWKHALRRNGNWELLALARGYLDTSRAIRAIASIILLLQDNVRYGKSEGVGHKTD